jgi:HlyD family secretion protein
MGVLPSQAILELMHDGFIKGVDPAFINPASLDIPLSGEGHRLARTLMPKRGERVQDMLKPAGATPHSLNVPMEVGVSYLVRADLAEALAGSSAEEQDLLVANAYKKLLNDDLAAYPVSGSDDDVSAVVSGSYQSLEEGTYTLKAYASGADSGLSLNISGLEYGTAPINYNTPVAIGTRGLFIRFEDSGGSYAGSSWTIEIPNKRGEHYVANLSAYESAKKTREIESSTVDARVAGINADIESRILRAPFNGIVSKVDIEKGEIATAGTVVATVISKNNYQVKVQVPEVDIVNLTPGLTASITLDAYGKDVIFPAKVFSVDQSETKVDGVTIYESNVLFDELDPRVLSGMTANIEILKAKVENVIAIPSSYIETDKDGSFVMLQSGEELIKTYVTTGLKGANGDIEITSGLAEGDTIIGNFKK